MALDVMYMSVKGCVLRVGFIVNINYLCTDEGVTVHVRLQNLRLSHVQLIDVRIREQHDYT